MNLFVQTSAEKMAEIINVPLDEWAGACHGVSLRVAEQVGGVVRRGYFVGRTTPGAYFHDRFAQHSWIELPDGRVLDPTRFAFVGGDPELWVGPYDDYDIGGCKSAAPAGPCPYDEEEPSVVLELFSLAYVVDLLGQPWLDVIYYGDEEGEGEINITQRQAVWLANLPVEEREAGGVLARWFAAEVYEALVKAGCRAYIPIDRLDWILPEWKEIRT